MESFFKFLSNSFLVIILIFIIIAVYCSAKAYNNTWTIEDNHFKSVYDDYDDCIKNNIGTGTTGICDDEKQVKYKNNDKDER